MSTRNVILTVGAFLLGAAGGVVGGYYFSKNKFQTLADKEIESVRKVYEHHFKKPEGTQPVTTEGSPSPKINKLTAPDTEQKGSITDYGKMYAGTEVEPEVVGTSKTTKPVKKPSKPIRVISPQEFQESEYTADTLIYYADKVLADSDGNVIHNINDTIGPEALSTFGRYLDDTVYVRDDNKQIDYEIIWDVRKYSSVYKKQGDKVPLPDED